jgi:hypothetical protein
LTEADGHAAQLGRIPVVRLDLVFEEPLHTFSMLDRALVVEQESNLTAMLAGVGFLALINIGYFVSAALGVLKALS